MPSVFGIEKKMRNIRLRNRITSILNEQGYTIDSNGHFFLNTNDREARRKAHEYAKAERVRLRINFIRRFMLIAGSNIPNGSDIEVENIDPLLIEVMPNSVEEEYFRWWNLIWWSLPYEKAYGRQMRFIIWDKYHNAVIGLIGLQSPILSWGVRDDHLNIPYEERDYWVNQSLSAQRLGAVPPYNQILGGKLVSLLLTSNDIRERFKSKYSGKKTVITERTLPARLLFLTTTGAFGKSSIYQRLKYKDEIVSEFIGYTQGSGSFHIPNEIYNDLLDYLDIRGYDIKRGFGTGPSRKLRLIDTALGLLGFKDGANHGIARAVYLFPLIKNINDVIQLNKRPIWFDRTISDLTSYWKRRWAIPRIERDNSYLKFKNYQFIHNIENEIENMCCFKKQ